MVQFSFVFITSVLATFATASPLARRAWPSGSVTCGSNVYSLAQVKSATTAGYAQIDSPIGSSESRVSLVVVRMTIVANR